MLSIAAIKGFFSFSNWSVYLIIGAVLVYGYYRIDALKAENDLLENQVEQVVEKNNRIANEFINFKNQVVNDLNEQKEMTARVNEVTTRNKKQMGELYDTFNTSASGKERDLEALSIAKPNLIESRVNDATKKVFDNVEKNSSFNDSE